MAARAAATAAALLLAVAAVTASAAIPRVAASAGASGPPPAGPAAWPAVARVVIGESGVRIPASFQGVSIEIRAVGRLRRGGGPVARMIALLRARGGPLLLRLGGRSVDTTWWWGMHGPTPRRVVRVAKGWLRALHGLTVADRLRVILALNVAVHTPAVEARFALAVRRALGGSGFAGVEVGNEPDLYRSEPWLDQQDRNRFGAVVDWTHGFSPAAYHAEYERYAAAVRALLGEVAIEAPDTTSPAITWLVSVLFPARGRPSILAVHRYALSTCFPNRSIYHPSLTRLLSDRSSHGLAASLHYAVEIARHDGTQLRVSELGAVSCGESRRISTSIATALWALDASFELVRAGVTGVNWHIRPGMNNAPFAITRTGVLVRPEAYGLALFASLAPAGARLLDARVTAPRATHMLKAWAVRAGSSLTVLLLNKGSGPLGVSVSVPARRGTIALVRRLMQARDLSVRYGGRWIGADGRWHGRSEERVLRPRGGAFRLRLPPLSATTLSINR